VVRRKITDKGIGNGISLYGGYTLRFPQAFIQGFTTSYKQQRRTNVIGYQKLLFGLVIIACVL
jgi:preprotein translocase subunit SecY